MIAESMQKAMERGHVVLLATSQLRIIGNVVRREGTSRALVVDWRPVR